MILPESEIGTEFTHTTTIFCIFRILFHQLTSDVVFTLRVNKTLHMIKLRAESMYCKDTIRREFPLGGAMDTMQMIQSTRIKQRK